MVASVKFDKFLARSCRWARWLASPLRPFVSACKNNVLVIIKARLARKGMEKVRAKALRGEKLVVLFIVTEPAKWKCQSVYDEMERSPLFDPVIGVTVPDLHFKLPLAKLVNDFARCVDFFESRQMKVRKIYDMVSGKSINLSPENTDIVFYPSAAFHVVGQMPYDVASFAISCYVPYFVPNYCNLPADCGMNNHRMFDFHFVLNESLAQAYRAFQKKLYDSRFIAVGHPALDSVEFDPKCGDGRECVIYAPHWTIETPATYSPFRYSTFEWSGRPILEYAQKHREVKWVFKPHPALWRILVDGGIMSEQEREEYYNAWRQIGKVVDSGDYGDVFNESFAMITDSASFLTEYAATGKPIIHLVSSRNHEWPVGSLAKLYETYYRAYDKKSLNDVFKSILEARNDPNRGARLEALKQANVLSSNVARRIVDVLKNCVRNDDCSYRL